MNDLPDGTYLLDATEAKGWTGPSGLVEIVTHTNNGHPWKWCYWLPNKHGHRPRCGIELKRMEGATFRHCLSIHADPLPK